MLEVQGKIVIQKPYGLLVKGSSHVFNPKAKELASDIEDIKSFVIVNEDGTFQETAYKDKLIDYIEKPKTGKFIVHLYNSISPETIIIGQTYPTSFDGGSDNGFFQVFQIEDNLYKNKLNPSEMNKSFTLITLYHTTREDRRFSFFLI